MKVLLLAGGWSPEREVSLKGGEQIAAALKERGHGVTLCDPAKDFERIMDMAREHDVAFINLHGAPGEDGLVQAILDRVNCPYQGAGPAGSFLALHKAAARQIFRDAGLLVPDGVFLPRHPGPNWKPDLAFPMFVKSNTGGSSLHLSRVTNEEELYTALNSLFSMGEEALVETAVSGREVTCGVLGEEALAPILVVSKGHYFDYHNKYAPQGPRPQGLQPRRLHPQGRRHPVHPRSEHHARHDRHQPRAPRGRRQGHVLRRSHRAPPRTGDGTLTGKRTLGGEGPFRKRALSASPARPPLFPLRHATSSRFSTAVRTAIQQPCRWKRPTRRFTGKPPNRDSTGPNIFEEGEMGFGEGETP